MQDLAGSLPLAQPAISISLCSRMQVPTLLRLRQTCRAVRACVDEADIWAQLLAALHSGVKMLHHPGLSEMPHLAVKFDLTALPAKDPRLHSWWPKLSTFQKCAQLAFFSVVAVKSLEGNGFFFCVECRLLNCESCASKCFLCELNSCEDCKRVNGCEGCSKRFCDDCKHITWCDKCGKGICEDCGNTNDECNECSKNLCEDCGVTTWCDGCSQILCEDCRHTSYCEKCHNSFCDDCRHTNYCEKCYTSFCEECGHSNYCEKCYTSFCEECGHSNYCEKCHTSFCKDCRDKHYGACRDRGCPQQ